MKHTDLMKVRQDKDAEEAYEINLTIDFSDATPEQMAEWAFANRKIAVQKMLRDNWDEAKMAEYADKGMTVKATDASKKPAEDPIVVLKRRLERGEISKEEARELLGL